MTLPKPQQRAAGRDERTTGTTPAALDRNDREIPVPPARVEAIAKPRTPAKLLAHRTGMARLRTLRRAMLKTFLEGFAERQAERERERREEAQHLRSLRRLGIAKKRGTRHEPETSRLD